MIKRLPKEWCKLVGVEMIDDDGFRADDSWNTPMTIEGFLPRLNMSTVTNKRPNMTMKKVHVVLGKCHRDWEEMEHFETVERCEDFIEELIEEQNRPLPRTTYYTEFKIETHYVKR